MAMDGISRNTNKKAKNLIAHPQETPILRPKVFKPAAATKHVSAGFIGKQAAAGSMRPAAKIKIRHRSIISHIDKKQITTIALTFVITFALSLATSQGLAKISSRNTEQDARIIATTDTLPRGSDLEVITTPQMLSFENNVQNKPGEITLPQEKLTVPDPLKQRKEFLKQYLSARGSVLTEHVDALSEQTQWKLIVGIARAESSFCKKHAVHNCWGIGGAWNLKNYPNYDAAISDVNRILEQHYIQAGLNSPRKIVTKWVGHRSDNWESAVQQELDALKNAP